MRTFDISDRLIHVYRHIIYIYISPNIYVFVVGDQEWREGATEGDWAQGDHRKAARVSATYYSY